MRETRANFIVLYTISNAERENQDFWLWMYETKAFGKIIPKMQIEYNKKGNRFQQRISFIIEHIGLTHIDQFGNTRYIL